MAPLVGMLGYIEGSRLLARRRLRSAFGQYVSPEVMDRVLREGTGLGGEVRTVSVLMSDLRGFTTLSERLRPDRISEMWRSSSLWGSPRRERFPRGGRAP